MKGEKGYNGGSFPLLVQMDERMDDPMGMLPNTRWEASHFAKQCALKLALLETSQPSGCRKNANTVKISDTTLEKLQPSKS
jgi:hypothetical protein